MGFSLAEQSFVLSFPELASLKKQQSSLHAVLCKPGWNTNFLLLSPSITTTFLSDSLSQLY